MNWREEDHPRDAGGLFTEKENGAKSFSEVQQDYERAVNRAVEKYYRQNASYEEILAKENKENSDSQDDLNEWLGEEFKGYKGQEAVEKLLQERHGHVKGAFHRDDIGDIDLVWGNDSAGLQHIETQRLKETNGEEHAKDIFANLSESVANGVYDQKNERGNFVFIYKKGGLTYRVIIAPEYHKHKITYILTAYRKGKKKK